MISSQQLGQDLSPIRDPLAAMSPPGYVMSQAGQVVFIQATGYTGPRVIENYSSRTSKFLGISRISIGIFSIILAIAALIIDIILAYGIENFFSFSGAGIWNGLFFILAGSFGVAAAKTKTFCLIVANMAVAIVSVSFFGLTYLSFSVVGIIMANDCYYCSGREEPQIKKTCLVVLYSLMLVLAVAECVCDIWSSVICCRAVCCGYSALQPILQTQPGQQVIYLNNPQMGTQPAAVPYSPTAPSYKYQPTQAQASSQINPGDSSNSVYGVDTKLVFKPSQN